MIRPVELFSNPTNKRDWDPHGNGRTGARHRLPDTEGAWGRLAGLAGSLVVMVTFQSLLFGTRPSDPLVIGTAATVFLVAASLAAGVTSGRRRPAGRSTL